MSAVPRSASPAAAERASDPLARLLAAGRPVVMGILNLTPDSFSDGGQFVDPQAALAQAQRLAAAGADIENVRAFRCHAPGMIDGDGGIDELAAVGEGVRRQVEDTHHGRPTEGEQPPERIRLVQGRRHDAALRRRRSGVKRSCMSQPRRSANGWSTALSAMRGLVDQYLIF